MKYNFIAIEGNIGAGKTSLANKIAADFNARLILEQFEENSFLPKFYKEPDKYAFPLEMSFMAARYHQLKNQLGTLDMFKSFTISDYFIVKSLIFAKKNLPEDEYKLYTNFFNIIFQQLPKPDLMVYLYVDTSRLQSNIKMRGRPYEQDIQDDYLDKIQEGYLEFIRQRNDMRIIIMDTNQLDFVNRPEDYEKILHHLEQDFSLGVHRITF
ncbi:MAG: deoxynucleoside kinase [Bacteroidales bacterium]|nr:deoxynucleoside kinase [Bacteroidales bacterium]